MIHFRWFCIAEAGVRVLLSEKTQGHQDTPDSGSVPFLGTETSSTWTWNVGKHEVEAFVSLENMRADIQ